MGIHFILNFTYHNSVLIFRQISAAFNLLINTPRNRYLRPTSYILTFFLNRGQIIIPIINYFCLC